MLPDREERAARAALIEPRAIVAAMARDIAGLTAADRIVGYNALRDLGWQDRQIRLWLLPAKQRAGELMLAEPAPARPNPPANKPPRLNAILQVAATVREIAGGGLQIAGICAFAVGVAMAGEIARALA